VIERVNKVLVVGSGGREHALVWSIAQSAARRTPQAIEIYVAPGNAGMADLATLVDLAADDVDGLVSYANQVGIDLVIIGPEVPLSLGLADKLMAEGIAVFGPVQAAARIESSKAFSKDFMRDHGIPTAEYVVLTDHDEALTYLGDHPAPIVVKASGLAAGKGAIVCRTDDEARLALQQIMVERAFGDAGDCGVIEEFLVGQEVSVLAFCDGKTVAPMLLAQDHKAAYDGDVGPNTGGMGCYAPAPLLDDALMRRVVDEVLQPTVDGMAREGSPYVGVLYAGLIVRDNDFIVLEFNCRFGDPETQVILPLLETDILDVFRACVNGTLDQIHLQWSDQCCVCVVMASGGYPGRYQRGYEIQGLGRAAEQEQVVVFQAGTRSQEDSIVTAGGRVLGVTAWDDDLNDAIRRAYAAVDLIHWPDVMFRLDIGAKGLQSEDRE